MNRKEVFYLETILDRGSGKNNLGWICSADVLLPVASIILHRQQAFRWQESLGFL